jgi:hypothetical protein
MEVWSTRGKNFPVKLAPTDGRSSGWWVSDAQTENAKTP